jgi:hypothetical protein
VTSRSRGGRNRTTRRLLEGNVFREDLTLYPAERKNHMLTRFKDHFATENVGEKKWHLGSVRRFDDAVTDRVKTLDYALQRVPFPAPTVV